MAIAILGWIFGTTFPFVAFCNWIWHCIGAGFLGNWLHFSNAIRFGTPEFGARPCSETKVKTRQDMATEMDFFSVLPEECVSAILSLTSPRDVCRSAATSKGFKSVADSDAVWGRFLPSDYRDIILRSVSPMPFKSKKQLYLRLVDSPILLDGGKLSFALDKASGKKCFILGARELKIVWGCTPQYWGWRSLPQSRFSEVAELLAVCWFEINGKIEARLLSPKTTYVAYLVFKKCRRNRGFDSLPINASIRFVGERGGKDEDEITNIVYLKPRKSGRPTRGLLPQKRMANWMEVQLGEFFNDQDSGEVEMCLMEIERGNWKQGIIIEGIELRPKFVC